jgi:hypothetical protein
MAKVRVPPNDISAAWARSPLSQVLPRTVPARWLHVLVLDQHEKVWIAALSVNLAGMRFAKRGKRRRAQARSGLEPSSISPLAGWFAKQTLSKPQTNDRVTYA